MAVKSREFQESQIRAALLDAPQRSRGGQRNLPSKSIRKNNFSHLTISAFILTITLMSAPCFGQQGGGGQPGGGQPGGGQPGGGQQQAGGGQQAGGQAQGAGLANLDIPVTPDQRNQGFVGITSQKVQEFGFAGASSSFGELGLAEGASLGGGENTSNYNRNFSLGGGAGGQGFGGVGTQNFFEVPRRSLRINFRPDFEFRAITPSEVVQQFASSFSKIPVNQKFNGQYQITVVDKTAIVQGQVASEADRKRLISQLRLQPGVYRIDDQLQVGQ